MSVQEVIARELGLSQATISRVISRPDMVKPATRDRVLKAMEKHKYQPNQLANRLRAGGLEMLGICVSSISNDYFVSLIHGVEFAAGERGWSVVIECTHNDLAAERRSIEEMRSLQFGGLLILPHPEAADIYRELKRLRFPFVFIDRHLEGVAAPFVGTDEAVGGRLVAEHLLQLGHRRIAHVHGPEGYSSFQERGEAFENLLSRHGVALDPRCRVPGFQPNQKAASTTEAYGEKDVPRQLRTDHTMDDPEGGREALRRLLKLPKSERPTAVMCDNDYYATGVMLEAIQQGLSVPDDLSIVGFSGARWTSWLPVPLTTIVQPAYRIGERAVKQLFDVRGSGKISRKHCQLEPRLDIQASTGPPPSR